MRKSFVTKRRKKDVIINTIRIFEIEKIENMNNEWYYQKTNYNNSTSIFITFKYWCFRYIKLTMKEEINAN